MSLNNIKINNTTNVKTGVVYDISKATGQTYETLADALGENGDNVPSEVREGGMTVRYVDKTSRYVQYHYIVTNVSTVNIFTDPSNWLGIDDEPIIGSENIVKSEGTKISLNKNLAIIIGNIETIGELTLPGVAYYSTQYKMLSGIKYQIYVQGTCWSANNTPKAGLHTSTHITTGANDLFIKRIDTNGFRNGTYFEYAPNTDLYLYICTGKTGDVVTWKVLPFSSDTSLKQLKENKVDKVSGKLLSTNDFTNTYKQKVDNNEINITSTNNNIKGIIFPQKQLSELTTIVTSEQVSEGDVLEVKYKGINTASRVINRSYNNLTKAWKVCTTTEELTAYYVVKNGFNNMTAGNGLIISCSIVDNISSTYRNIESKDVGFVTSKIGNLFFRELYIEGIQTDEYLLDYRFMISRNPSGNNTIILQRMSDDINPGNVASLTSPASEIEKNLVITVPQANQSGIKVYCIVDWNAVDGHTINFSKGINANPTLKALNIINSPRIYESLKNKLYTNIIDLDLHSFTRGVGNDKISEFISLDGIKYIDYRLHKPNEESILYFYKNPQSSYPSNYWTYPDFEARYADHSSSLLSDGNVAQAKIAVPKGYKYFAVRVVSGRIGDYIRLITKRQFDVEDNIRFLNTAKCISDNFSYVVCGEPSLFYDKKKGLVYCKYLADNGVGYNVPAWSRDPEKYACLSVFPIGQPERAQFHQLFDTRVGFTIDGTTYKMVYFGMSLHYNNDEVDGFNISGTDTISGKGYTFFMNLQYQFVSATESLPIKFDDGSDFNYENYVLKTTGELPESGDTGTVGLSGKEEYIRNGITEYYGIISATPNSSSTFTGYRHPQLVQIVYYETYREISIIHDFNINFQYEKEFIIDGDNWYYIPRSKTYIHYFISNDAGLTWSTGYIRNSNNSMMRALRYDGDLIVGIPTYIEAAVGMSSVKDEESVYVTGRYSWELLRGNASEETDMNNWEQAFTFASNYGINYFSLMLVGKDLYIAYSKDSAHIWDAESTRGVSGKCLIMFARIGNIDNNSLFGDI